MAAETSGGSWRIIDEQHRTISARNYSSSNNDVKEERWTNDMKSASSTQGSETESIFHQFENQEKVIIDENTSSVNHNDENYPIWNVIHGSLNICISTISRFESDVDSGSGKYDKISLTGIHNLLISSLQASKELQQKLQEDNNIKSNEQKKLMLLISSLRDVCDKQKKALKSMTSKINKKDSQQETIHSTVQDQSQVTCVSTQTDETPLNTEISEIPILGTQAASPIVNEDESLVKERVHLESELNKTVTDVNIHIPESTIIPSISDDISTKSKHKLRADDVYEENEMLIDQLTQSKNSLSIQNTMMKILQCKVDRLEKQMQLSTDKIDQETKRADSSMRVVLSLESIVSKQRAIISSSNKDKENRKESRRASSSSYHDTVD